MKKIIMLLILFTTYLHLSILKAEESYHPPKDLWKGILAENISGGFEGLYSVTCCYKNRLDRGMSLGCIGIKRKNLNKFIREQIAYGKTQGIDYEKMAKDIVNKVFYEGGEDVTFGATHYENIEKYGVPWWAKDMIITIKIGSHTFYKEK